MEPSMDKVTDEFCRLCRSSKDVILFDIFRKENNYMVEEIEFLLKEKPYINDGLPQYVCHRCSYKIRKHKTFRDLCTESLQQLQTKHTSSDDEIMIVDERTNTPTPTPSPSPCSSQYRRQIMFNVQDVRSLRPQDAALFMSEASSSSRSKRIKRYKLQHTKIEESFFQKRQHSPETSRLMRQVFQQQQQQLQQQQQQQQQLQQQQQQQLQQQQQQHRPEFVTENGKLQHGLVGSPVFSPNLTETRPEVVDEQLGTVGYIVQEPSSLQQVPPFRRRMDVRPHVPRVNDLHPSSFSDTESHRQDPNKVIRVCCRLEVPDNTDICGKHVVTRVVDGNDSNCAFLMQPPPQPRVHRPMPPFTEHSLARATAGQLTCEHCGKVFTNMVILRQHFQEKHIQ